MYVDWEYYKIFYYVAKYQNFTKAARVLGNNQPNITHAMNRLESQLNCVLFIRSNRGVTLTPEDIDFDAANGMGTFTVDRSMQRVQKDTPVRICW